MMPSSKARELAEQNRRTNRELCMTRERATIERLITDDVDAGSNEAAYVPSRYVTASQVRALLEELKANGYRVTDYDAITNNLGVISIRW